MKKSIFALCFMVIVIGLLVAAIHYTTPTPAPAPAVTTLKPSPFKAPMSSIEIGIPELASICKLNPAGHDGKGAWDCHEGTYRQSQDVYISCSTFAGRHTDANGNRKPLNICVQEGTEVTDYLELVDTFRTTEAAGYVLVQTDIRGVEQFGFAPGAWRPVDIAALTQIQ
jgi:hypothetical protein